MKRIRCDQGSELWKALRQACHCGSEAAIVMGESKHVSRDQLLYMKATATAQEFSDWQRENLLEKGHEIEAVVREMLEEIMGESLFPDTVTSDDGTLLRSFDGMSASSARSIEIKSWNKELAERIRTGQLIGHDYWQLEHGLAIGAEEGMTHTIFVCSDGTWENTAMIKYEPVPGRREKLLAAYKIFDDDLAKMVAGAPTHEPARERVVDVEIVKPNLPALTVELSPALRELIENKQLLNTNIVVYRNDFDAWLQRINTKLETDEDFAQAKADVEELGEKEKKIAAVCDALLKGSFGEAIDSLHAMADAARKKRLYLTPEISNREKEIKLGIRREGERQWREYLHGLEQQYGFTPDLPAPDLAGAMHNKRKLGTMRTAINDAVARAKAEAAVRLEVMQRNIASFSALPADQRALFPGHEQQMLVQKPADHFESLVQLRIKEDAERRERDRKEAEAEVQLRRIAAIEKHLDRHNLWDGVEPINHALHEVEGVVIDETFGEFRGRAEQAKSRTIAYLKQELAAAKEISERAVREQAEARRAKEAEIAGQSAACETSAQKQSELTMIEQVGSALQESRDMSIQASLQLQKMGASALLMDASELIRTFLDTIMNALGGDHPAREDAEKWMRCYENFDLQLDQSS